MRTMIIAAVGLTTGLAVGQVSYTGGPGGSIPDNGGPGNPFSSTLTVTDSYAIADLNLDLSGFNHTFVGDLIITLEHNGTSVVTVDRPGVPDFSGFGWGYDLAGDYSFDDSALVTWQDVNGGAQDTNFVIGEGAYLGENLLSAFNGMDVAGDWTLTISDNAGFDTGLIESWGITATPVPAPAGLAILGLGGLAAARRRR
jgi:MYXO-CTERM domain-containing protein